MNKKNNYEKSKKVLRTIGLTMSISGLICIIIGMIDFFSSFNDGVPKLFFLLFIGLPLFGIGLGLTIMSYADKIHKYAASQVMPTIKESVNYVMGDNSICPKCGEKNEKGSLYCNKCGEPLKRICPKCGEEIPFDSNYCNKCGSKIC